MWHLLDPVCSVSLQCHHEIVSAHNNCDNKWDQDHAWIFIINYYEIFWKVLWLPCSLHASKVHFSSQEVTTCSRYLQYFVLSMSQVWRVPQVVTLFRFIIPNSPPETFSHPHVSVLMTASSFVSTPWRQTEILQLENTFIFRATNFDVWRSFNQDYQLF